MGTHPIFESDFDCLTEEMAAQLTTLKAAQADGMYYPPHWRPEMGSLDKMHGSHHLTHQAKKIKEGILIVRIELPFPIWCTGCNNKFALATRYTAEKFCVGKYLSTPVYKFKMKCRRCPRCARIRRTSTTCVCQAVEEMCAPGTWRKTAKSASQTQQSAQGSTLIPCSPLKRAKTTKTSTTSASPSCLNSRSRTPSNMAIASNSTEP